MPFRSHRINTKFHEVNGVDLIEIAVDSSDDDEEEDGQGVKVASQAIVEVKEEDEDTRHRYQDQMSR
jgi:hypothetical protein